MRRVDALLRHPLFRAALEELARLERERPFCRHDLEHFLAVARVMRLMNAEEGQALPLPLLYAAALLHDLGRAEEYRGGAPHALAALPLAERLLSDCDFTAEERTEILCALPQHSSDWAGARSPLGALLYRADKKSRPCYLCPAAAACSWPMEKRSLHIEY